MFTYIVELANALVDTFEVYIAYGVRPQTPDNYEQYFDKSVHLIKVNNFTRSINPVKDVKAYFEIKKISKKVCPDIIHLHSSKAGILGRWCFNGHRIPIFYTPHGYSFLMKNCNGLKRMIYKLIEEISAKRYCMTISCSEGENSETLRMTKNALCINNGVNCKDIDYIIQTTNKIRQNHTFTVFTLGRICYQKNPSLFNEIAKAMPEVQFLWIGDGELRDVITSPNIKVTGWCDRNLAIEYSMNADVFMLTSLWEGLPISLLEAMYMKKLCIVSDVIGNHDVIQNCNNGFVCKTKDDYVDVICKCKTNNYEMYRTTAYNQILKKYNKDVMASQYKTLYIKRFNELHG